MCGGVQWLVFRNDGTVTAAEWARQAAMGGSGGGLFGAFDRGRPERRQAFVLEVLRQTLKVKAYALLLVRTGFIFASTLRCQAPQLL